MLWPIFWTFRIPQILAVWEETRVVQQPQAKALETPAEVNAGDGDLPPL
jgi:hypothetical protein